MNTQNIEDCLMSDRFSKDLFEKVCSRDEFISSIGKGRGYGLYVFNTHYSDQPGEHWLAARYTKKRIELFDSFGRNPKDLVPDVWNKAISLVKREEVYWNNQKVQGVTTNTCGDYCVFVCLLLARGWIIKDIIGVLLLMEESETRDHSVRRFILNIFGEGAVGEVANPSNEASGLDKVHIQYSLYPNSFL